MVDEHFGINIVEYMVRIIHGLCTRLSSVEQGAGLIPLAHASGGPLLDIILSDITDPTSPALKRVIMRPHPVVCKLDSANTYASAG